MGMFDNVVILDETLAFPAGHRLAGLQTKSFDDPSMSTYLIRDGVRSMGDGIRVFSHGSEEEALA